MATKKDSKKPIAELDYDELDVRRVDPRVEAVKGFLENFSTFAAFGLVGGAVIAAVTIGALAISAGGIGAVTAAGLGAKSIALGITFAASAITGMVGGTHYAAHRMHQAERTNDMLDEAKEILKRKQARAKEREAEPERDRDSYRDERPRPKFLQDALDRGPRETMSHRDRLDLESAHSHASHSIH